jgi:hypothetical protein
MAQAGEATPAWRAFCTFYGLAVAFPFLVLGYVFTPYFSNGFDAILRSEVRIDTNLVTAIRAAYADSETLKASLFLVLQPLTPTLAAIITVSWYYGRGGLRTYFSRFVFWRRTPVGQALKLWTLLIASLGAINLVAFAVKAAVLPQFFPGEVLWDSRLGNPGLGLPLLLLSGLLTDGGALEEGGWRGFSTPLLQPVLGPLRTALLIGLLWGLWHVPVRFEQLLWARESPGMLLVYSTLYCLSTISMSLIYAYFFRVFADSCGRILMISQRGQHAG